MNINKKKEEVYFDIISGPSKDALFDACKYAYNKAAKLDVNFSVIAGYTAPLGHPKRASIPMEVSDFRVLAVGHEGASGESFNLYGRCRANLDIVNKAASYSAAAPYKFKAEYNTKTRNGRITFIK